MQISFDIEISEENIKALIEKQIADKIVEKFSVSNLNSDSHIRKGVRDGMDTVVKEMLYANKDKIIDMVVERASAEMVRKGMPKLLEKMTS